MPLPNAGALVGAEGDEGLWQKFTLGVFEVWWMKAYILNTVYTTLQVKLMSYS